MEKLVKIYTDHKSLKHLFSQKNLNMRQGRRLELTNDYQCEIKYHLGKANQATDALSRKSHLVDEAESSVLDSLICGMRRLLVENSKFKERILDEAHVAPFSVHPESTKMYRDLKRSFCWEGMKKDIALFIARCTTCRQVKTEHQRLAGYVQPLLIPE
ncbi:uncharacterized protein LOC121262096 [Juglans microcarpa x Juglans regia]|uniref:uncharacterized protein LOC121262096 n=1 Tax=Juglans microcarpa x Juglans regia TaxID=2249226 RepID=UPI001B7DF7E3|nr:uncharacterized protein LOC121262096 [Juglans microcarpa x Juglans regia]